MFFRRISTTYFLVFFAVMSITTYITWNYARFAVPENGILTVSFLDVGQGDAIYIRAPNGNDVMIDGGPDRSVVQALHQLIPPFDRDIDMVIVTHSHKDHIAGLIPIFEDYEVGKYLHSEITSGTSYDTSLADHAKSEPGLQEIIARRGQRFILDEKQGVFLDILFPDQDTSGFKDANDASIVAKLVYGDESFMLTGDANFSTEDYLTKYDGVSLKSTVLKLGHHGSKTSSGDAFLDAVRPEFAVVSAGKNNTYHHPNPEAVERITKRSIPLFSTIELGTVTFQTDGKNIWKK